MPTTDLAKTYLDYALTLRPDEGDPVPQYVNFLTEGSNKVYRIDYVGKTYFALVLPVRVVDFSPTNTQFDLPDGGGDLTVIQYDNIFDFIPPSESEVVWINDPRLQSVVYIHVANRSKKISARLASDASPLSANFINAQVQFLQLHEETLALHSASLDKLTTDLETEVTSRTDADTAIGVRIDAAETRIEASEQSVESLEAKTDSTNTALTSLAGAYDLTTVEVERIGQELVSTQSDVSTLISDLTAVDARVDTLEHWVGTAGTEIANISSDLTDLTARVGTTETELGSLESRVDTAESNISTQSNSLTTLTGRVDGLNTIPATSVGKVHAVNFAAGAGTMISHQRAVLLATSEQELVVTIDTGMVLPTTTVVTATVVEDDPTTAIKLISVAGPSIVITLYRAIAPVADITLQLSVIAFAPPTTP